MTERERDERDLKILRSYEFGAAKKRLAEEYNVPVSYIGELLKEAFGDE